MPVTSESGQSKPMQNSDSRGKYVLARNFVLRMTGFPVETILSGVSPDLCTAADLEPELAKQTAAAADALLSSTEALPRSLRRRVKSLKEVQDGGGEQSTGEKLGEQAQQLLYDYRSAFSLQQEHGNKAEELYERELARALKKLYEFVVSEPFQQVLLLSSPELKKFTPQDASVPAVRNSHIRQREFTWISYLQRLATKNETISFFGPTAWGDFNPEEPAAAAIELCESMVAEREVYVERWVAEILAKLISADPEVFSQIPLQLADDVQVGDSEATFLSTGKTVPITEEERELLRNCECGLTGGNAGPLMESLLDRKVLIRALQVPISPYPFEALRRQVQSWPENPGVHRWSAKLQEIEDGRAAFERATDLETRESALETITRSVISAGADGHRDSQALYASRLPINEDCRLNVGKLALGEPMMEQMLDDLAPWYELWRDMAGLYTTRLHEELKQVWMTLGGRPVPLPVFLRACAAKAMPIKATGGTGFLAEVEEEIQRVWREQLGERWIQPVVQLTEQDTSFIRNNFKFRRMRSFDNMAPDVQIVAPDSKSLSDGKWSLLLAEIHPDFTKWQHCFFVWCPDKEGYARDFDHQGGHDPAVAVGNYPPFFASAHITLCIFPYDHSWSFVGVQGPPGSKSIRSADALVTVTEDDVVVVHQDRVLGSLLNTWNTALNTHRLELRGGRDHSPRLQVGRAIVQRETWTLQPDEELRQAAEAGGYKAFAAFRRFRRQHGLPENIFVRGCLPRLNFHKDAKPVFMDFRNPLLTEVLSKLTTRFRKLSIGEMLPRIEDCWLQAPDGNHYSCEFRTVVMATKESREQDCARTGNSKTEPVVEIEKQVCVQG